MGERWASRRSWRWNTRAAKKFVMTKSWIGSVTRRGDIATMRGKRESGDGADAESGEAKASEMPTSGEQVIEDHLRRR